MLLGCLSARPHLVHLALCLTPVCACAYAWACTQRALLGLGPVLCPTLGISWQARPAAHGVHYERIKRLFSLQFANRTARAVVTSKLIQLIHF